MRCPFCESSNVEPFSLFGQQLLTLQYYCNSCRTPFEKVRDERSLLDFSGPESGYESRDQ